MNFGCKYVTGDKCEDTNKLHIDGEKGKNYKNLMNQFYELCKTPSFEGCLTYQELEKLRRKN
ncbi:MAG: hypothetical protein AABX88_02230 [Nanoarchaeota archaeon]